MAKICIIPARGGSKRIPRKNVKLFLGKPILAYSIEAAMESELFDEVMVSTDDQEIAEIAIQYGASVPFLRSAKNSDDFATTFDVIEEVIQFYKDRNTFFDSLCCVYSCAPFVTSTILTAAYNLLKEGGFDTVFPIIPYSFPIQRALSLREGKVTMIRQENLNVRSQDLESTYHDAGQFYWCRTEELLEGKSLLTSNTGALELSEFEAQDIDTSTDWKLAELKYNLR